jgi:hypothetical protein
MDKKTAIQKLKKEASVFIILDDSDKEKLEAINYAIGALETEDTVKDLEKSKKRHSIDDIIDYLDNIEKGVELLNNKIK